MTPIDADWVNEQPSVARLVGIAIEAAIKSAPKGHAFVRVHGDRIGVFWPKSIDYQTIDQKEFGKLRETVEEIIETVIGRPVDEIMRETELAA